jgi:hypothetical protein
VKLCCDGSTFTTKNKPINVCVELHSRVVTVRDIFVTVSEDETMIYKGYAALFFLSVGAQLIDSVQHMHPHRLLCCYSFPFSVFSSFSRSRPYGSDS